MPQFDLLNLRNKQKQEAHIESSAYREVDSRWAKSLQHLSCFSAQEMHQQIINSGLIIIHFLFS